MCVYVRSYVCMCVCVCVYVHVNSTKATVTCTTILLLFVNSESYFQNSFDYNTSKYMCKVGHNGGGVGVIPLPCTTSALPRPPITELIASIGNTTCVNVVIIIIHGYRLHNIV